MIGEPPAGVFISFEGGEGAGKSTQIARLAARLRAGQGIGQGTGQGTGSAPAREVVTTREPGGTPRAEALREAVLAGRAKPYGPFAEAVLFSAARIDHLDQLIRPALARGAIVLCDRFTDSTRAYQGAAGGLEPGVLAALERVVVGPTRPHLTLILDLPAETGLARARARGEAGDRFEAEALGFHQRLRAAFRAIAQAEPERCAVIDAAPDADAVEAAVAASVAARMPSLMPGTSGASRDHAA